MAQFTRTLTFRTQDLGRASNLVLNFSGNEFPGIYRDVFPIVFKVASFGATGSYWFTVTYKSDLGITRARISSGVVEPASLYTHIDVGEKTILTKGGDPPVYSFSIPQPIGGPSEKIMVQNDTGTRENFGLGFFESFDRGPSQILLFEGVDAGSSVLFKFKPILEGFISSDYQEGEVLRGRLAIPPLFNEDLAQLPQQTYWKIGYDNGVYSITRE